MRELRTVVLLALPVVVVVAGAVALNALLIDGEPARPRDAGAGGPGGAMGRPPPPGPGPRAPGGGIAIRPAPAPEPGEVEPPPTLLTADMVRELLLDGSLPAWQRLKYLISRCRIDDPVTVVDLLVKALGEDPDVAAHFEFLLPHITDEQARLHAVAGLRALVAPDIPVNTYKAAVRLVGLMGDSRDVAFVAGLARSAGPEDLERFAPAALALASLGGPEAAAELRDLLVSRLGSRVEHVVARALADFEGPEAVEALSSLLGPEQPIELRLKAMETIGLSQQPGGFEPLSKLLGPDEDQEVRKRAMDALGHLGTKEAIEEVIRIRRANGDLAFEAGVALGRKVAPEAVPLLRDWFPQEPSDSVKVRILDSLGESGVGENAGFLREILESPGESWSVRGRSARALGALGDRDSVDLMTRMLEAAPREQTAFRLAVIESFEPLMRKNPGSREKVFETAVPVLERIAREGAADDSIKWLAGKTLVRLDVYRPR